MNVIRNSARVVAGAANGNPVITTIVSMLFFFAFTCLEAQIEELIWGARFHHWMDPVFASVFIAYAAYSVYACALFNSGERA